MALLPRLRSTRRRRQGRLTSSVRPRSPFSFCLLGERGVRRVQLLVHRFRAKPHQFSVFGFSRIGLSLSHQPSAHGFLPSSRSLQHLFLHSHAITPVFSFGLVGMNSRSHSRRLKSKRAARSGCQCLGLGLTLRSTRTQPHVPSALPSWLRFPLPSHRPAAVGPVSFDR
jgi:hypothetical protein